MPKRCNKGAHPESSPRPEDRSFHVIAVAWNRIDRRDLLDGEIGDDLDFFFMYNEHLLDAHAIAEALAVLRLQRKGHAGLDLDRVVERPNARDHRRIVLREAQAMAPQIRRRLVLFIVAPGLLCRGPFFCDLTRGGAGLPRRRSNRRAIRARWHRYLSAPWSAPFPRNRSGNSRICSRSRSALPNP